MSEDVADHKRGEVVVERRGVFVERLTYIVVIFAGFGGLLVMVDPVLTFTLPGDGNSLKVGGGGFSEQLKGAVIQTLLIGGWTTALAFWLRITPTEQRQQETVSRMAEAAAPAQARAVAAARGPAPTESVTPSAPIKAENVNVDATNADININQDKK